MCSNKSKQKPVFWSKENRWKTAASHPLDPALGFGQPPAFRPRPPEATSYSSQYFRNTRFTQGVLTLAA